jgi:hypothetical protein
MARAYVLETAIQQALNRVGICSLDELATLLPGYSRAKVFAAVDRLTCEGAVTLQHPEPFRYLLSLKRRPSAGQAR